MSEIDIRPARIPQDMDLLRTLFREYATWLNIDLCFQGFEEELAALPGDYAPPRGAGLIAWAGDDPAGCVALRPMDADACEMKRMWVRPAYRGVKLGRRLAVAVMDEARRLGYRSMRLDTLHRLTEANRLYDSLGFAEISAYYHNPNPDVRYMEAKLGTP